MKNAIMQVTYFLNGPMINLLLYCHIILYWEKATSYEKLSHSLTFETQIVWKIQRFNAIDGSTKMLKYSWISKAFNKIEKKKTFYEAQSPLQEAIQTPPGKSFLGKDTEIYRHLLSQCFENAVLRHLEMVQCKFFFWHKLETCLLENL